MAAFPSIQQPSKITEEDLSFRLYNTSEAGYTLVRARATAIKKQFELEWEIISSTDKNTLQAFFASNFGESLTWTHFETSTVYTVVFKDDDLSFEYIAPDYWRTKLTLKEV